MNRMETMTNRLALVVSFIALTASAQAQTGNPGVRVESAWARSAPMMEGGKGKAGSGNGAIYVTLANAGKERDALIAAASDAAVAVELHESYQDMGMMMMRPVKRIDIPAGGKVEMKPGGYHIMLLNLKRELKAGQTVNLTLQFQKAGKLPVHVEIR